MSAEIVGLHTMVNAVYVIFLSTILTHCVRARRARGKVVVISLVQDSNCVNFCLLMFLFIVEWITFQYFAQILMTDATYAILFVTLYLASTLALLGATLAVLESAARASTLVAVFCAGTLLIELLYTLSALRRTGWTGFAQQGQPEASHGFLALAALALILFLLIKAGIALSFYAKGTSTMELRSAVATLAVARGSVCYMFIFAPPFTTQGVG